MKAEDVKRLFLDVRAKLGHGNLWWEYQDQALLTELARACEQHGIERAKALATCPVHLECDDCRGDGMAEEIDAEDLGDDCPRCAGKGAVVKRMPIDWSALDAEIAKENEDG